MSAPTEIPAIAELRELGARFCLWKTVVRDGKSTKMPIQPTGKPASSTDRATWAPLADCEAAQKQRRASGVGFFFNGNGNGYGGADLDACRDPATGAVTEWAWRWIREINSYTEISPSGTGVKIYFKADPMPKLRGNKRTVGEAADGEKVPAVELYVTGRYFALTGEHLDGTPDEIVDATEAVERLVLWIAEDKGGADAAGATFDLADLPELVAELLEADPKLKAAWASGEKLTKGNDSSASGRDFSLAIWLAMRGWDDAHIAAALRAYPHGQVSKLDAKEADRQIKRHLRKVEKRREQAARVREAAAWLDDLILGDRGPSDCIANVIIALRGDPAFKDAIRFDELRARPVAATLPWHACDGWREWTGTDDSALAEWCQLRGLPARPATVAEAVQLHAERHPFNPLRDRLDGLTWDGVPRLGGWLATYLGAPDDAYTRAVGRAWLISAVARVYWPSCKVDHALILEGAQGQRKSTACAILALSPEWFTDEIAELGSKDSAQDLHGKWIVELAELSSMTRATVEKVKAFISRSVDHYRPSYGRRSQDFPRRCVFIGSTNADTYLADETGGRRFWPVKVGTIDTDALRQNVEQMWAEAVAAFHAGEVWHLSRELEEHAREQQAERRTVDPWEAAVMEWAERQIGPVTIADALCSAVQRDLGQCERHHEMRVGAIFKANGWTRRRSRTGGCRAWVYLPPDPAAGPTGPTCSNIYNANAVYSDAGSSAQTDSDLRHSSRENGRTGMAGRTTRADAGFSRSYLHAEGGPAEGEGGPAWQDIDHWRARLRRAASPAERRAVAQAWAEAAGATVTELDDGPPRVTLPDDLPPGLALAELRQYARGQGLLS